MKMTGSGVPVDTLISTIKDSIKQAGISRTSPSADLRIKSVRLILEVVASKKSGGKLEFCVPFIGMKLALGGDVTSKNTHTMDIALAPPAESGPVVRGAGDVEAALVDAVTTIRQVMASAARGNDPWELSEAAVDIAFGVTRTGTISIGVDGELTGEVTNTIRLGLISAPAG
jgi:hypothetical protein